MANQRDVKTSKGLIKRYIAEKRVWWYTDFGKYFVKNRCRDFFGLEFTVMSYNILSQTLLNHHTYLYRHCNSEFLSWHYRCPNLLQEIVEHEADVICLQELEEGAYVEMFLPRLVKLDYIGLYKKKSGNNYSDGCAIFFKKSCFSLVTHTAVEYKNSNVRILDRDHVGLVVVLQPEHTSKDLKLCIATTHILFNPRRGDIKLTQLRLLFAEIEKHAFKCISGTKRVYHPIILCGDMNSEPYSPLYNFITRGVLKYKNLLSGDISGQFAGFSKGRSMQEKPMSLSALGINENTCYENANSQSASNKENQEREILASGPCCYDNTLNMSASSSQNCLIDFNMPNISTIRKKSGHFYHPLNFVSAYSHYRTNGDREITTFNDDTTCSIDYIFYRVENEQKHHYSRNQLCVQNDGPLQHIGSYGLINLKDLKQINKLPNAYLSSDHICLISRFVLKL